MNATPGSKPRRNRVNSCNSGEMPSSHLRAKDVFLQALSIPMPRREAFVAEVCGTDARLRQEVESLLAYHEDGISQGTGPASKPTGRQFDPGEVFASRYRVIARLGRGGMGEVWQVEDLVLGTPVALKFIRSRAGRRGRRHSQRGAAGPDDHPSGGLPRVRRRRGERRGVLLDGAGAGRGPCLAHEARRAASVGEGGRHRASALRGPGGGARRGRVAPGSRSPPTC